MITSKIASLPNGTHIWHETFGQKTDPAVLLMMGNSCDAILWPESFCQSLADRHFYVIRFDQRDTGLSSSFDFSTHPYTLMDMVRDATELLDNLNIKKAHVVGYSTGGLIAELMAIHCANRVTSLVLLMTSINLTIKNDAFSGKDMSNAKLPPPKQEYIDAILNLKNTPLSAPHQLSDKVARLVEMFRLSNGTKCPFDEAFYSEIFTKSLTRLHGDMKQVGHESNHALATSATPVINAAQFASISRPTLVIGGTEDPILPPEHAIATSQAIPNSELCLIENMGHVLNPVFFHTMLDKIVSSMRSSS